LFHSTVPAFVPYALFPDLVSLTTAQVGGSGLGLGAAGALGNLLISTEPLKEMLPWKSVANWTHSLSKTKTTTDTWMDVVDDWTRGGHHRWQNHHPVDFSRAWWNDASGKLNLLDYTKHLGLDVITINGIPLLPEFAHKYLLTQGLLPEFAHKYLLTQGLLPEFAHKYLLTPGWSVGTITNWTHLNILEFAFGGLSLADGGVSFVLAVTGHLPWQGVETFIFTFGQGTVEVVIGYYTANPLLIAGGVLHIGAGSVSLWDHWHIPEPSLLDHIVPILLPAGVIATCATALRLGLVWGNSSPSQRVVAGCESATLSVTATFLSALSPLLAPPAVVGYSLGKLAWQIAEDDSSFWERQNLTSPFAMNLALNHIAKHGDPASIDRLKLYLAETQGCASILAPVFLESPTVLSLPPAGAEHVWAKDAAWATDVMAMENLLTPASSDVKILSPPDDASQVFGAHPFPKEEL